MRTVQTFALCILVAFAVWFYHRQTKLDIAKERAEQMAELKKREDASNALRDEADLAEQVRRIRGR